MKCKIKLKTKLSFIAECGLIVCKRHPRANTVFRGEFMVVDNDTFMKLHQDPKFAFKNAMNVPYCVVGDDMKELINDAFESAHDRKIVEDIKNIS